MLPPGGTEMMSRIGLAPWERACSAGSARLADTNAPSASTTSLRENPPSMKRWTASSPARRLMRVGLSEDDTMAQAFPLEALASRFIDTESLPWIATAPGSKMKVIYHDP